MCVKPKQVDYTFIFQLHAYKTSKLSRLLPPPPIVYLQFCLIKKCFSFVNKEYQYQRNIMLVNICSINLFYAGHTLSKRNTDQTWEMVLSGRQVVRPPKLYVTTHLISDTLRDIDSLAHSVSFWGKKLHFARYQFLPGYVNDLPEFGPGNHAVPILSIFLITP